MREVLTTIIEVLGAALVVAGVAMWSLPAALIVAGLLLAAVGYVTSVPARQGGDRR